MKRSFFLYLNLLCLIIQHIYVIQPVCIISIPKSGTHLLIKLINLIRAEHALVARAGLALVDDEMKQHMVVSSHAIFNQHNQEIYANYNKFSYVLIYRDPRAQVVSMAHWLRRLGSLQPLDELITILIADVRQFYYNSANVHAQECALLTDITSFYNLYIPWMQIPGIYVTTFEKLIGPQGGGALQDQYHEIRTIAAHIGVHLNQKQIVKIANTLFGESATFHEGKIDSWRKYFTSYHKELFKKHGGQLLITLGYEKDFNW